MPAAGKIETRWPSALCLAALLVSSPVAKARAQGSKQVFVDQGLSRRGLRLIATAAWQPDAVAVATAREVFLRWGNRAGWQRLATIVDTSTDDAAAPVPRILSLAWARQGVIVGLPKGLLVIEKQGRHLRRRPVPLSRLPVRALAVAPKGRRVWAGQGRWLWRYDGKRWQRLGRGPGGPWRLLASHPVLRATLLGSDGRALYRSSDGGRSWRLVRPPHPVSGVVSGGFSLRGVRRGAASLLMLTRRSLLLRRSGRFRQWPGPVSPRAVLGAQRPDGADWVLANALFRAVGRGARFREISLGLPGARISSIATDWRRARGVWCVTHGAVHRLSTRRVRRRVTADCRRPFQGKEPPLPRYRLADWLPRVSFRLVGYARPGARWSTRPVGPALSRYRRWRMKGLVQLSWPLDLSSTTASVSRLLAAMARARWKRQERWRRIWLAHCRHRTHRGMPADALWVKSETVKALMRWVDRKKE